MKIYLPANGTTAFGVPQYRNGTSAQTAWCRVKEWDSPTVASGTLTITQSYNVSQSGDTLTSE